MIGKTDLGNNTLIVNIDKVDKKLWEEQHETTSSEKYILNEKYTERHYRKIYYCT